MARPQFRFSLLLILAGCGGSTANNFPVPMQGDQEAGLPARMLPDGGPDGGADGAVDRAMSGGDDGGGGSMGDSATGEPSKLKVTVVIASPAAAEVKAAHDRFAPSVEVTIDSSMATAADTVMEVKAVVTKMGAKMSAASVVLDETKVEQTPEGGAAIHRFTDKPLDLSPLDSGNYELKVTARTVGGVTADASVQFVIDAGPIIRIDLPGENKYYRSSATVDVTITDPLFGPIKKENVSMWLGQQQLPLSDPTGPDGSQYNATISFGSYDPPLEGDQLLTIRAKNINGTETVARRKFIADNTGPTIDKMVPDVGALIGRVITISAVVTDPAGVLDSSVVAVVAHGDAMYEVKLQPAPVGGTTPPNTYQALFDTARLPTSALYPSISFRASDIPGNQSSRGYLLSLDNTPPVADLDPPADFHQVRKNGSNFECSWPFDPLGDDSVDDLQNVNQLFDIRARIEDQGNSPLFGDYDVTPVSGIDDGRVQLLILDDTSQALVVDTNNDGKCDAVNPILTPTTTPMSSTDALLINLVPIAVQGLANYLPYGPGFSATARCGQGTAGVAPDPLCGTSGLTTTMAYLTLSTPAIYTIPPIINDKLWNLGRQFDALGNHLNDGWVCLAVAVADKLGNLQVSRPLRICVDKDGQGDECGANRPAPPDCTGTLTATQPKPVVDATKHCSPWRTFIHDEYRPTF
jgi:hypothetical protein